MVLFCLSAPEACGSAMRISYSASLNCVNASRVFSLSPKLFEYASTPALYPKVPPEIALSFWKYRSFVVTSSLEIDSMPLGHIHR